MEYDDNGIQQLRGFLKVNVDGMTKEALGIVTETQKQNGHAMKTHVVLS